MSVNGWMDGGIECCVFCGCASVVEALERALIVPYEETACVRALETLKLSSLTLIDPGTTL